jgi:hypothetical protein
VTHVGFTDESEGVSEAAGEQFVREYGRAPERSLNLGDGATDGDRQTSTSLSLTQRRFTRVVDREKPGGPGVLSESRTRECGAGVSGLGGVPEKSPAIGQTKVYRLADFSTIW